MRVQVKCRVSVRDRIRCMFRDMVRGTVRAGLSPRKLHALNPQQSRCLHERPSGVHEAGSQSGVVFEFQVQINVWATLRVDLRNPLMQRQLRFGNDMVMFQVACRVSLH